MLSRYLKALNLIFRTIDTPSTKLTVKKEEYNVIYPMGYTRQISHSIILDYINHPIHNQY